MRRILVFMIVAVLGAMAASGCGEREQTALYKDGKYRGKPDGRPWESAEAAWNKATAPAGKSR